MKADYDTFIEQVERARSYPRNDAGLAEAVTNIIVMVIVFAGILPIVAGGFGVFLGSTIIGGCVTGELVMLRYVYRGRQARRFCMELRARDDLRLVYRNECAPEIEEDKKRKEKEQAEIQRIKKINDYVNYG